MESEDFAPLPRHIAIIMDGNGRWATRRHLARVKGHARGMDRVEEIVTFCAEAGIRCMTLYAFSIDNWDRPASEVRFLMARLKQFLKTKTHLFTDNHIRLCAIGRRERLSRSVREAITAVEEATADFERMTLYLALSYGSREEIVDGVKAACDAAVAGKLDPAQLTPEIFETYMETGGVPDPDLLIRTGEEQRLSNFLLWQSSYAELFFSATLWPDFNVQEMKDILRDFGRRERRFGLVRP